MTTARTVEPRRWRHGVGLGGNDEIRNADGNDKLYGGPGNNNITYGAD